MPEPSIAYSRRTMAEVATQRPSGIPGAAVHVHPSDETTRCAFWGNYLHMGGTG